MQLLWWQTGRGCRLLHWWELRRAAEQQGLNRQPWWRKQQLISAGVNLSCSLQLPARLTRQPESLSAGPAPQL